MGAVPNMISSGAFLRVTVALLCFTFIPQAFAARQGPPSPSPSSDCDQPDVPSTFKVFMFETSPSIISSLIPVGRDSAVAELEEDYLDSAEIKGLADKSTRVFVSYSSISFGGSCHVPVACIFWKCGCPTGGGRKLLQCVPYYDPCGQGNSAPTTAPGSQPVRTGSTIAVALCTTSTCVFFEIKRTAETAIVRAFEQLCPGVLTFSNTGSGVPFSGTAFTASVTSISTSSAPDAAASALSIALSGPSPGTETVSARETSTKTSGSPTG